jgi:hypothetical protein
MTHDIDAHVEEQALPATMRFAYDGLTVSL